MPTYQQESTQTQTNSNSSSTSSGVEVEEQALLGNQAIIDIVKAENNSTGQRELNPHKNGIVFLGMNGHAHDEANALNRYNRDAGGAKTVTPSKDQDEVTKSGVKYDLTTVEGAASFIATLGMPDQMAVDAADFLLNAGSGARDELGSFIQILAEAEMGERQIDRMVLSGHSVGSQIWGDDNGEIAMNDFDKLSDIFPKAFGQVQHLMLSACYSGGETNMMSNKGIWEGAESIWAYHDSSPGTWSGAMGHMEEWESATESGKDAGGVDPELAKGHRKAKNVSTWNSTDGYQGGEPMSDWEIRSEIESRESMFKGFFDGTQLVENSQTGPLREYYGLLQSGISHVDMDESFRAELMVKRDKTIRLLYFGLISSKFQAHHSKTLNDAYQSAGLTVPDFGKMNRAETLKHISEVEQALSGTEALRLLKTGLIDLDISVIPTTWV